MAANSPVTLEQMCALLDEKLKPLGEIREKLGGIQSKVEQLEKQNTELKQTVDEMRAREKLMLETINHLEKNSRQFNLIFRGVNQSVEVSVEKQIETIFKEQLRIGRKLKFKEVSRIGQQNNEDMTILVQCAAKNYVISILKNAKYLKGTSIMIHKDQSKSIREKCGKIRDLAKKIKEKNKEVKEVNNLQRYYPCYY